MNMEEFKFLVLGTKADWEAGIKENLEILADGSLALQSVPYLQGEEQLEELGLDFPTVLAINRCGIIYMIDTQNCRLYIYDPEIKEIEKIECIGGCGSLPAQFKSPKGIAVGDSNLYVADTGNNRVQVFFLPNFQLRYILGSTDDLNNPIPGDGPGAFNQPWNLVLDSEENLYVLDRGNFRIQKFNLAGEYLREFGQDKFKEPIDIAIDCQESIYALDSGKLCILKFNSEGELLKAIDLEDDMQPSSIAVDKNRNIYVADNKSLKIHKFDESGEFLGASREHQDEFYGLAVDRWGNLYASLGEQGNIALFKEGAAFLTTGSYISKALDCGRENLRWHKILLEADIPPKTRLEISYYASDKEESQSRIKAWSNPIISPEDALIQTEGRYLWLKIAFSGDEQSTPTVKRIRAYYPRMSYLRYLPGTYQENTASRDFLERFLSLFETFFSHTEDEIHRIPTFFDPMAVRSDFLPWLSSWLAFAIDDNWPEAKKRELILNAIELYKKRGTKEGLLDFIEIYSDARPIIIEHFQFRGSESTEADFKKYAHRFSVILYRSHIKTASQREVIERIIESEKPAHTRCYIHVIEKSMRLGVLSQIGVDTIVGRRPVMRIGALSTIGIDSVVGHDKSKTGRISMSSKVGITTVIS